ncbi:hypothetical protein L2E82_17131 [Cichorium intybus]|uniref:Uncharacterized protein n=1 Tax=Cichorium intybus TaxID=13427 RepID=A0ACB9F7Z8_CICIN|nr:hypothetical protein L2E82_17131 [Cichorium intybus]
MVAGEGAVVVVAGEGVVADQKGVEETETTTCVDVDEHIFPGPYFIKSYTSEYRSPSIVVVGLTARVLERKPMDFGGKKVLWWRWWAVRCFKYEGGCQRGGAGKE